MNHIGFVITFSMSLSLLIILVTMAVTEGMLNMGIDCARQKMEMRTNHTCGKTNMQLGKYTNMQIRKYANSKLEIIPVVVQTWENQCKYNSNNINKHVKSNFKSCFPLSALR